MQTSELEAMRFLDWQLSRYGSPTLDLFYNIFTSTDKDLRDEHYDELLNLYHSTLSATVQKLGSDAEKLFSYVEFQTNLKKFGKFALILAPLIIELRLANPKNVKNLDDFSSGVANSGNDAHSADIVSKLSDDAQKQYNEIINDIVSHLYSLGYL